MRVSVTAALALTACGSASPGVIVDPVRPGSASIHVTAGSWGRPIIEWTVDAIGHGEVRRSAPGAPGDPPALTTQRIAVGVTGYNRLLTLLAPASEAAHATYRCSPTITDLVYGTARFVDAEGTHQMSFTYGCTDAVDRRVLGSIDAAMAQIDAWTGHGVPDRSPASQQTRPAP